MAAPALASVLTLIVPAVILPVPEVCVTAPVAVRSSVPLPTFDALAPTPRLTAPVRTNALAFPLVLTLRLVAAMSIPLALLVPIWPLAFSVTLVAVMVCVPASVIDPALRVSVLPARLTAAPIVSTPVLAISPTTMGPVAPVENAVISAAEISNAEAPAIDMAWPAVFGLSVKAPEVVKALLPALTVLTATVSAIMVIAPVPALTSMLVFWLYAPVPASIDTALLVAVTFPATVTLLLPLVSAKPPGAVMVLSWTTLFVCVFRFSALALPVRVAASVAAFTAPVCVMEPPAARVTAPAVPDTPLLMPDMANPLASVY